MIKIVDIEPAYVYVIARADSLPTGTYGTSTQCQPSCQSWGKGRVSDTLSLSLTFCLLEKADAQTGIGRVESQKR